MGKHYPEDFKNKVLNDYLSGESGGSITLSRKYGISCHTIDTWISKYKRQGNLNNDISCNRGRKAEKDIDYKERYQILKKYQTFLKAQRDRK